MVSCRLRCMDVGESKRPHEQRKEHEPADDERNDDSIESMPREDRRPLAGEEHRPEETRHHEEDRHAEDVNGECEEPRHRRCLRILIGPEFFVLLKGHGGVQNDTKKHHHGTDEVQTVIPGMNTTGFR